MWGLTAEAIAEWMGHYGGWGGAPMPPGTSLNYRCRACDVFGTAPDDESLTCWCCESADNLDVGKIPGFAGHRHNPNNMPGDYGRLEDVAALVG